LKTEKIYKLSSVRQIIDASGNVKNHYTYKPFGETLDEEGTLLSNPFMFTGQYFDSEIEEYYLRARQYNSHISRFTSRDPVFGKFEEPLSLHKYLYCQNEPVNRIDPAGLWVVYVTGTGMGSFGWSGVRQSGFIFDDKGNIALMNITGIGGGTPGAFAGMSIGWYPWAENIDEIKDIGVTLGGSGRLGGGSLGLEFMFGRRFGIEVSFGGSIPADIIPVEFHSHVTKTELYQKVNVGDLYENLEERLFEVKTVGEGWAYLSVQALLHELYIE